jgi:hypothetical protein
VLNHWLIGINPVRRSGQGRTQRNSKKKKKLKKSCFEELDNLSGLDYFFLQLESPTWKCKKHFLNKKKKFQLQVFKNIFGLKYLGTGYGSRIWIRNTGTKLL